MDYNFSEISKKQAEKISNWHYEGEYSFYDYENDEEDIAELLSPRGDIYYMVKKGNEEIGFFCFETEEDSVEIGLGMKPELTGRGMGLDFFKAGLNFAISKFNPKEITLSVATFNKRAIKVYKRAGFESVKTFMQQDEDGSQVEFLKMEYEWTK
ncbi:GNAT family N-acetyltransferase [Halobacillus amylolyticus]|uniref:GNAT family N-acetyltransferase n=1 Tax=Halobacillus amylolyticus TaxID=2932259 RepID=A0ABY4HK72_9BACI|nr:GNAT family protein [Halobacillus amylolyticus]UOR13910.1 GNAT family N-acetyltransferase [Halobacillus amylolyticus]